MTYKLTRAQFQTKVLQLKSQSGITLASDAGDVPVPDHKGLVIHYAYVEPDLVINATCSGVFGDVVAKAANEQLAEWLA